MRDVPQGSLVDGDVDVLGLERLHDDGLSSFGPGLSLGLLSLGVLFLIVQLEVGVVRDGPELVAVQARVVSFRNTSRRRSKRTGKRRVVCTQ